MTFSAFAALSLSCAMVVMLLVELRIPFRALRAWLARADHVAVDVLAGGDEDSGPWGLRSGTTGAWLSDERYTRLSHATARLANGHRVRAYLAELVECPYCASAYVTAAALVGFGVDRGFDVLWYWPGLWWASAVLVVTARRIAEA